jgi:membrane protein YdbS with pleckstrin-like domain
MLISGVVALRAAILLKPYRGQPTAMSKKVWRAYAAAMALIFTCGFGAIALLAQTWRAWCFFGFVAILCVSIFLQNPSERV